MSYPRGEVSLRYSTHVPFFQEAVPSIAELRHRGQRTVGHKAGSRKMAALAGGSQSPIRGHYRPQKPAISSGSETVKSMMRLLGAILYLLPFLHQLWPRKQTPKPMLSPNFILQTLHQRSRSPFSLQPGLYVLSLGLWTRIFMPPPERNLLHGELQKVKRTFPLPYIFLFWTRCTHLQDRVTQVGSEPSHSSKGGIGGPT